MNNHYLFDHLHPKYQKNKNLPHHFHPKHLPDHFHSKHLPNHKLDHNPNLPHNLREESLFEII